MRIGLFLSFIISFLYTQEISKIDLSAAPKPRGCAITPGSILGDIDPGVIDTTAGAFAQAEMPIFEVSGVYAEVGHLDLGAGINCVQKPEYRTGEFRVEYQFGYNLHKFRPLVGGMATLKKDYYLYTGFLIDLVIYNRFIFAPNFALGYYHRGEGRNLGYPLEFRSGLEIGWQFENLYRVGVHFYHMSNAGLGRKNPGLESIVLFFEIPI